MRYATSRNVLLAVIFSAVLSACGSNPYSLPDVVKGEPDYRDTETTPSPSSVPKPKPDSRPVQTDTSGPHSELLAKADTARGQGDYDQALAYLERAQRIDPDNAEIYLAMARTHDAAGNSSQSRATAERGMLYCNGSKQCKALRAYTD